MQFILTTGWEDGTAELTQRLVHELADGKRVVWFLSGGSNIPVSVQVMNPLSDELSKNLTITLADERFGGVGHANSNFEQLMKAGFEPKQATLLPVLHGASFEETTKSYRESVEKLLADCDVSVGQFGIGEDGHIVGILPHSPATAETEELVIGYESEPFTRLTLTFTALRKLTTSFTFAFGVAKQAALHGIKENTLTPADQPSLILNELTDAYLYNDQIGEL